jgi:monoamine oxidase
MQELVRNAGLHLQRDRYTSGPLRWRRPGDSAGHLIPRLTPKSLRALVRIVLGPASLGSLLAATAPDRSGAELDQRSVADWLDRLEHSGSLRHILDCLAADAFGGAELGDVSLPEFADLVGREGSGLRVIQGGLGLSSHIVEGSGAVCDYLAGKLVSQVGRQRR